MRDVHPVYAGDARCSLLYDLERTFVVPVPPPLQFALASALAKNEFEQGALRSWLVDEELLTADEFRGRADAPNQPLPEVTDVSLDLSGACNMGCVYCFEKDIDSRLGPMSDDTLRSSLDFAFAKSNTSPRLSLHFGSGEPLLRFKALERLVCEAEVRAEKLGKQVSFDLTTNGTLVTDAIARFLAAHPFSVRVSCDGPPRIHDRFRPMINGRSSYAAVEAGIKTLLAHLPERLTINSVIAGDTRLAHVWQWAKALGLLHYHVIKVGAYASDDFALQDAELKTFRSDLDVICEDMWTDLLAGRRPIDYQPITKVVRRLMIPQPITRFCGVAGSYLGVASNGKVYPCFRHIGLKDYELGSAASGIDDAKRRRYRLHESRDVDSRDICKSCWARYLCGGGCYADSVVYGSEKIKPQTAHCPFWRMEIEAAIRFYDRLRTEEPEFCLNLFGDTLDTVMAASRKPAFAQAMNCS